MAAAFYPKYKTCLSIFPLTQFLSLIRSFNCLFLDFGLMLIVCYLIAMNCFNAMILNQTLFLIKLFYIFNTLTWSNSCFSFWIRQSVRILFQQYIRLKQTFDLCRNLSFIVASEILNWTWSFFHETSKMYWTLSFIPAKSLLKWSIVWSLFFQLVWKKFTLHSSNDYERDKDKPPKDSWTIM